MSNYSDGNKGKKITSTAMLEVRHCVGQISKCPCHLMKPESHIPEEDKLADSRVQRLECVPKSIMKYIYEKKKSIRKKGVE